jgi:flagellar basal-body rod protein FlgF
MESSLYVALSGQLSLQRRLDTIASNVANSSTAGYRGENMTFMSIISRSNVTYASIGEATFSRNSGPVNKTDDPFDVAIQGDAFLAIQTPRGTAYTKDGRMRLSQSGDLETLEGLPILDSGGSPIQINSAQGAIQIARNGSISQAGNTVATIGLYRIQADTKVTRGPNASLIPDKPAVPVVDFASTGVLQGFSEAANVNPMLEMTRLINVSRAFEAVTSTIDQSDRQLTDAVKTLGNGSGR